MPLKTMPKKHAAKIIKMYRGGLVKQLPQDADLLDEYTKEQYLDDDGEQDDDVAYYFDGGEVTAVDSLKQAFGTTDKNNSFHPESSMVDKMKSVMGLGSSDGPSKPKKMSQGGVVMSPFAKALKMKRGY